MFFLVCCNFPPTLKEHKNIGFRNPPNSLKPFYSSAIRARGQVVVKLGARDPNLTVDSCVLGVG